MTTWPPPRPMHEAPTTGEEILLLVDYEGTGQRIWRLARWDVDRYVQRPRPYWNMTNRANSDRACVPLGWLPLPPTDIVPEEASTCLKLP